MKRRNRFATLLNRRNKLEDMRCNIYKSWKYNFTKARLIVGHINNLLDVIEFKLLEEYNRTYEQAQKS